MRQAPIGQERFESIEAYVLGAMPPGQRVEFERLLAADEGLREELEMQREHILATEMAGVERLLKELAAGQRREPPADRSFGRGGWLKYAAVVALMALGAAWWLTRPSPGERLFAQQYVPDPGLPVPMSAVHDPVFQDAMVAYKLGEYQEAAAKWEGLLGASPGNDTLRYYIASARLADGRAKEAVPLLEGVARDSGSVFQAEARWYLFLAYLREGDAEALKRLGMEMENDPERGEQVRRIEEQLR